MNKNLKVLIATLLIGTSIAFVGCNDKVKKPDTSTDTNIEDNDDKGTDEEGDKDNTDKEDDKDAENEESEEVKPKPDTKPDTKPESAQKSYKAYYMDESVSFLEYKTIKGDKDILDPQNIMSQIDDGLGISPSTKVLSCTISNYNTVILNLSKEIYENKVGSGIGSMRLEGIARTYMSAFSAKACIVQVEGEGYSDGHVMLGKFDAVPVSE